MLSIVLLSIIPLDLPIRDHVDIIEHNHFYDEHGRHVFDQLVFWEWNRATCRHEVRDWRLIKSPSQIPVNNRAVWWDGDVIRDVRGGQTRETWSQFDPELVDRANLPKEHRRELYPSNLKQFRSHLK